MSLSVCIADLIEQGKVPRAKARGIQRRYDKMVAAREGEMGRTLAEAEASQKLVAALEAEAAEGARRKALQAKSQADWLAKHKAANRDAPMDVGAMKRELELTEYRIETVASHMLIEFDEMMARHRPGLTGEVRHKAELDDITRARFGEKVANQSAAEVAEAMGRAMEMARQRRNRAGGNTGKLDNYGLPMRHDSTLVRKVPFAQWSAHPAIERAQVLDTDTGAFAEGARRLEILQAAYANIRSDGAESMVPGGQGKGSMGSRRQEARIIHFANADDWMTYAREFGGRTNAYDVFLGHMRGMAREIVLMEDMGPTPSASLRFRQDWLAKSAGMAVDAPTPGVLGPIRDALADKGIGGVGGKQAALQRRFDVISGAASIPDSERWAKFWSAVRAQQYAAKLGSATITAAPTDLATTLHRAKYNDLPAARMVASYAKMWADTGGLSDGQAVRLGLVADEYLGLTSAAWRYSGEEMTGEVARRVADASFRLSALNRHTRIGQNAFMQETVGYLTEMRGRSFDQLAGPMQRMLQRYDIDAAGWDTYRATPTIRDGGAEWIVPAYAGEIGERVGVMLRNERDFAVLMPDLRTRALMGQFKPGSWTGEALRMGFMLKSFSITMLSRHLDDMVRMQSGFTRVAYASSLFLMLTTAGAVALWSGDTLKGRDPRRALDEDGGLSAKFLAQAMLQGGGFGLVGDLIRSGENRYGGGIGETVVGPFGSLASNVIKSIYGNATAAGDGDPETETQWSYDAAKIARNEMPGGSLWYARLAFDRLIYDHVLRMADPEKFEQSKRSQARFAEKQGTQLWFAPGESARAPDLSNIAGSTEQPGAQP